MMSDKPAAGLQATATFTVTARVDLDAFADYYGDDPVTADADIPDVIARWLVEATPGLLREAVELHVTLDERGSE